MRWVCVPPLVDIDASINELQIAKDHGACGVFKKGDAEVGYEPNDPYFFPLYEEAERRDMPICFHTGSGAREARRGLLRSKGPAINGIYALLEDNLLIGSDYTHQDTSHELESRSLLEARIDREEIQALVAYKMTHDNPKAFYGL